MAKYGFIAQIGGDTSGLTAALKDVDSASRSINSELRQVNQALKLDPSNTALTSQKMQLLAQQVKNTKEKLAELKSQQEAVNEAVKSGKMDASALREYQREVGKCEAELKNLKNQQKEIITQKFDKVMSSIASGAKEVGKAALTVVGAASTAVGTLAEKSIECYSEYEQLAGGVETLFGTSADTVKNYAAEAFSTVGMSCNEYMETVTGFAASLVSGLDGDTAAAAEKANVAVTDMADNANKMGTDITSIQNAYQGFAKQNYTMLDNLKLGYGGTKEEMERLLEDAEKLQKAKGFDVSYDVSSFSDIVDAIHAVQEEMGITGTTADEASRTIQGSISAMKAAWTNLLTGMSDDTQDINKLVSDFSDSLITVSKNVIPRIEAVLPQMTEGITQLVEELLPLIPETLEEMLPGVLDGANSLIAALLDTLSSLADTAVPIVTDNADEIIDTLISGLISALPRLASSAADLCTALITAILDNAETITQGAADIVVSLANGLSENADKLIPAAVDAVLTIADTLINNIDELLDAGEKIIEGVAQGLIEAIPVLLEKAPVVVIDLLGELVNNIPESIEFAVELAGKIADGLINYNWKSVGAKAYKSINDALENALHGDSDYVDKQAEKTKERISRYSNLTQEQIDKMIADNQKKLGEWNDLQHQLENVDYIEDNSFLPDWMRTEMDMQGETNIREYLGNSISGVQRTIEDLSAARETAISEVDKTTEEIENALAEGAADVKEDAAGAENTDETEGINTLTEALDEALTELESRYKTHKVTEEQYWAERKSLLEQFRDDDSEQWWEYYDKVTDYYDKLAETEKTAREKEEKARESELKELTSDYKSKFDELYSSLSDEEITREEFNKKYLDLVEECAEKEVDISEYAADKIAAYDEKIRTENLSAWEKASKEITENITKAYEDVTKAYETARDGYIKSLSLVQEKITDNTGKERYILQDFKSQTKALREYQESLAKLKETGISEDLLNSVLSLSYDSGERQGVINEILGMNEKQRKKYYSDADAYYAEVNEAAKKDTAEQLSEADEIAKEGVEKIYSDMPAESYQKGMETAQSYLQGIMDVMSETDALRLMGADVGQSAKAGSGQSGQAGGNYFSGDMKIVINVDGKQQSFTLNDIVKNNVLTGGNTLNV